METSPREIGERKQTGETLWFQCIIKMANNKTESIEVFLMTWPGRLAYLIRQNWIGANV
jgi:hypothetical protein